MVDDDSFHLRMAAKMVSLEGYQVRQASSALEALELIEQDCPDLLITDWNMPDIDGLELCRKVRLLDLPHYVYVVFLSGRTEADDIADALQAGADDYMKKPAQRSELVARLYSGTRIVALERQLSRLANTDPLTGLPTKRTFDEHFVKEWHRSERYGLPLSFVITDIDFFKRINDTFGHPAGDQVLKGVAAALKDSCRMSDFHCRYGGEEFCALLPETDESQAAIWADRLRRRLANLEFKFDGKPLRITSSFGVAQRGPDTTKPEDLTEAADQALVVAKQSGRDRVVCYSSIDDDSAINDPSLESRFDPFFGLKASNAMTMLVAPLRKDDRLGVAAKLFLKSRLGSSPVVDESGGLVGILSEKDLLCAILSPGSWNQTVADLMKPNVVAFESSTSLKTVYGFLCRVSIRQVVITEDGKPIGAISRSGLVRWFGHWLEAHGHVPLRVSSADGFADQDAERPSDLTAIALQMASQVAELQSELQRPSSDYAPVVVGGATRMHELANDLLAFASPSQSAFSVGAAEAVDPPNLGQPTNAPADTPPVR